MISGNSDPEVFRTVRREGVRVVRLAIDFDRCRIIDEEVDSLEGRQSYLRSNSVTCEPEARAAQTFGQRFAGNIRPLCDPTKTCRKPEYQLIEIRSVDKASVECPVEGRYRIFELLIDDDPV